MRHEENPSLAEDREGYDVPPYYLGRLIDVHGRDDCWLVV